MAETTFTLDISIRTSLDKLIAFHSNMTNHIQIHPLIQKIELVEEHTNTKQQLVSTFRIQDKLYMLGFIPYRFYYQAIRTKIADNQFQFEVASPFNITMQTTVEYLQVDAQIVQLKESVYIKAPSILLNYTQRTAQKAHTASFEKLKSILEA